MIKYKPIYYNVKPESSVSQHKPLSDWAWFAETLTHS